MRILQGVTNINGRGGTTADFLRDRGLDADFIVFGDVSNYQNHDQNLMLAYKRFKTLRRLMFLFKALWRYDVFHFYFGLTILPWGLDLPILRLFGKRVVMSFCGSDVRLSYIAEKAGNKLRSGMNQPKYDNRKKTMLRWQRLWVHKFIATRGLLASVREIIPEDQIADVKIHLGLPDREKDTGWFDSGEGVPVVCHAPSIRANKGTRVIRQALQKVKAEFMYLEIHDTPHNVAVDQYQNVDIFIDQMLIGGFGLFALEGMALGRPVIGYIDPSIYKEVPDLPVVNATPENLHIILDFLLTHRGVCRKTGKAGKRFVENYANEDDIFQQLMGCYGIVHSPESRCQDNSDRKYYPELAF